MAACMKTERLFRQCRQQTSAQPSVRIVSYNILAEKYSGFNSYCPPEFLSWNYRSKLLLRELESYSADLLCLQEVQTDVFQEQLEPWMQQHGYGSLHHPRRPAVGSTTAGPPDGVSLHYKTQLFRLLASQRIRFADHVEQVLPSRCCNRHDSSQSNFLQGLQQREEGAVMALLQHLPSQQQLLACSTHLHWNPQVPDIKLAQAAILCHCINSFLHQHQQPRQGQQQQQQLEQQQLPRGCCPQPQHEPAFPPDIPIVIGGDFNSLWQKYKTDQWDRVPFCQSLVSGVYQLLHEGAVPPTHPDHPANRLCSQCAPPSPSRAGPQQQQQQQPLTGFTFTTSGLQLKSSHLSAHGREPTLTTRTSSFSGCLDYIWLSKPHWQVSSTLEMPYQEPAGPPGPPDRVTSLGPCPNKQQPSDHLAVGCDAVLLPAAVGAAGHVQGMAKAGHCCH